MNKGHMFYRDHQNLYYDTHYYEEPRDHYYQEPWWYQQCEQMNTMLSQILERQEREIANADIKLKCQKLNTMLSQALENKERQNSKMEIMFNKLDCEIDTLSNHVKRLETRTTENVKAIRRQQDILLEEYKEIHQVEHVEANTLKSDTLQEHHENTLTTIEVSNLITSGSSTNSTSFAETGSIKALVRRSALKESNLRSITTPPEKHHYIPKVSYPVVPYKQKTFQRHISSVAICSNVEACSPEPTRHTMPWFEESFLCSSQLSC